MKITIASTEQFIAYCGVECRMWRGVTENGAQVYAFIPFIGILAGSATDEFNELKDVPEPFPVLPKVQP